MTIVHDPQAAECYCRDCMDALMRKVMEAMVDRLHTRKVVEELSIIEHDLDAACDCPTCKHVKALAKGAP